MAEVGFQLRLRAPDGPPPCGGVQARQRHGQRAVRIAQSMLQELGGLDAGDDGRPARPRRQRGPRLEGLAMAPESTQEVGAVDGDPCPIPCHGHRLAPVP